MWMHSKNEITTWTFLYYSRLNISAWVQTRQLSKKTHILFSIIFMIGVPGPKPSTPGSPFSIMQLLSGNSVFFVIISSAHHEPHVYFLLHAVHHWPIVNIHFASPCAGIFGSMPGRSASCRLPQMLISTFHCRGNFGVAGHGLDSTGYLQSS